MCTAKDFARIVLSVPGPVRMLAVTDKVIGKFHDEHGRPIRELHGVTLAQIVEYLVARLGFETLATEIPIRCFAENPSVKSSLTFLRRTPWARTKVEELYIATRIRELQCQDDKG
jgi:uncharacterized protein (DUF2132 family)